MIVDYIFDGSFAGLLTAVFESYERKHLRVQLLLEHQTSNLFGEVVRIHSNPQKAERVWKGLEKKTDSKSCKNFYKAFLSEDPQIFQHLLNYAWYLFNHPDGHFRNYGNVHVLAITQMSQKVHREKHRMEAFVRFQKSSNGLYFAIIHPDFNVLPLIVRHFRSRYADQPWVIYDKKRKYGIHYDLQQVHEVTFDFKTAQDLSPATTDITMDEKEGLYTTLWKDYFKSTNIVERKNIKLHIQHVPKRYWRYLTEKEDS